MLLRKRTRSLIKAAGRLLVVLAIVALSGCGPVLSLLCSGPTQTDMDCE
jgi:hypothetical protein